ncbi:hypothetical protein [Reticulibacter mediterranei]|uniref:hypothetical protein n=1 Tax=Reticulibacter mediterranei TaxID=2778369 RepID=UPI001C69000E|nr:hypothetical protein [Reticulibacter mediterranei]
MSFEFQFANEIGTGVASSSVKIQTPAQSFPSTPCWFGEAVLIVEYLRKPTLIRMDAGGGSGLDPCSCSGLPVTRGEREAGRLVVDAETGRHPEKTAGRAEKAQNDHHEARGMLRMAHSRWKITREIVEAWSDIFRKFQNVPGFVLPYAPTFEHPGGMCHLSLRY